MTVERKTESSGNDALEAGPIVFGFHTLIAWKRKVDTAEKCFLL